ncbi:membrane dipeptidase [Pseudoflavitalea sp. G-6-1-2]|uniref:dipeptidase n=1 Tax=Pseudoflavitalea sp. G-6-1-2 TaxID=2728841 RepID=UPI00146B365D|nr:dipeptidase [Pseudoflavitalea sp. G-6-1-2]NML19870.1 membrane dipeptidase [Pseudoflavitalea sp. G-6-1-2]
MRKSFFFFWILFACHQLSAQGWKDLHFKSIVVDTHNDILTTAFEKNLSFDNDLKGKTHSDLKRFAKGGIDVQIFSVWCDGSFGKGKGFARANQQIDTLYAVQRRNPGKMMIVTNSTELQQAVKSNKLAAMIGVEGGHMIEDRIDYLDSLYKRGARYLTLTWNNSTSWASSAHDESKGKSPKGLNDFGKEVVRHMNKIGMLVDLSHVGEQTFWDAINTTTLPVIVSHSCAHALCPVFRNLTDDQIKAVGKNGGVIHLNFFSGFVDSNFFKKIRAFESRHRAEKDSLQAAGNSEEVISDMLATKYPSEVNQIRAPFSLLFDHLDHIVKLIGTDHVGLGSDFDGVTSTPQKLNDVTDFPLITKELMRRGYTHQQISNILGGNFLRLLQSVEQGAKP